MKRYKDLLTEKKDLEELSGKTLRSYSAKASDAKGHRKLSTKKVDNRYKGVAQASKKLSKLGEEDEPASPDEAGMAMDQAKFIGYVAEEVMEYIQGGNEFPEWMQNKLTALHEKAKGMHAVMAGKYNESVQESRYAERNVKRYASKVKSAMKRKDYKNVANILTNVWVDSEDSEDMDEFLDWVSETILGLGFKDSDTLDVVEYAESMFDAHLRS